MSFGDRLISLRKRDGLTRQDLADRLQIPYTTLRNYETDQREPGHGFLIQIARLFDVSVDSLIGIDSDVKPACPSSGALKLAWDYDRLDPWGQKAVRELADNELSRCTEQAHADALEEQRGIIYTLPEYFLPASAGTGQLAGNEEPEDLELTKRPPRGASYVVRVSGNSMEPTYHDGDRLFIQATVDIYPGQVGVFFMDGQQWVKELGDGVLLSHNPAYPPRPMTDDVRCQGLVLGVCDDSYFE